MMTPQTIPNPNRTTLTACRRANVTTRRNLPTADTGIVVKGSVFKLRSLLARLLILVCLMTMMPIRTMAWGTNGHRITALIALALLNPRAKTNVLAVLEGKTIANVATWPDELKRAGNGCVVPGAPGCNPNYRPETVQWHFVDIPINGNGLFSPTGDYCRASRYGDCIVPAIEGFRDVLNRSTNRTFTANSDEQKRKLHDALSFIVHFLGDIHQPLHCADNNDGGGNNVLVTWQGEPKYTFDDIWNLHSVWDDYLVQRNIMTMPPNKRTYDQYAQSLVGNLNVKERNYAQLKAASIETGHPENTIAWAEGSHALAKTAAYNLPTTTVKTSTRGFQKKDRHGNPLNIIVLDDTYFNATMPAVAKQLQLGGVRLARILNEIYDKDIH
jgi:nuclease S1